MVNDFASIDPVLQHQVECAAGEMLTAGQPSAGSLPSLAHDTRPLEFRPQQRDRANWTARRPRAWSPICWDLAANLGFWPWTGRTGRDVAAKGRELEHA